MFSEAISTSPEVTQDIERQKELFAAQINWLDIQDKETYEKLFRMFADPDVTKDYLDTRKQEFLNAGLLYEYPIAYELAKKYDTVSFLRDQTIWLAQTGAALKYFAPERYAEVFQDVNKVQNLLRTYNDFYFKRGEQKLPKAFSQIIQQAIHFGAREVDLRDEQRVLQGAQEENELDVRWRALENFPFWRRPRLKRTFKETINKHSPLLRSGIRGVDVELMEEELPAWRRKLVKRFNLLVNHDFGYYDLSSSRIRLSPAIPDEKTLLTTIDHEVGHHVHFWRLPLSDARRWQQCYEEEKGAIELSDIPHAKDGRHLHLEVFAETFAWFHSPQHSEELRQKAPGMYQFFETLTARYAESPTRNLAKSSLVHTVTTF